MAKTKVKETTEVAVKANTDLDRPSFIPQSTEGLENVRQEDLIIPRIVLEQALSPGVKGGTFAVGDLINSLSEELICPFGGSRLITPIKHWIEWIEWISREDGGGIKARSTDPTSELAKRCAANEKCMVQGREVPAVTEYHSFLVALVDGETPSPEDVVCLSLGKTNHKVGRELLTKARQRQAPLDAGVYSLSAEEASNKKGDDYFIFKLGNAGFVNEEMFKVFGAEAKRLKDVTIYADATESTGTTGKDDLEDDELT